MNTLTFSSATPEFTCTARNARARTCAGIARILAVSVFLAMLSPPVALAQTANWDAGTEPNHPPFSRETASQEATTQETTNQDSTAQPATTAQDISSEIFGPRRPVDEAYGAFQRGYYLTALALALERADKNDAAAQTLIATIYANGLGVGENAALASSWYALAAENGDPAAMFQLALLYQNGRGVPRNREKAAKLFKQAADKGYREAIYNLALLHVEGIYAEPSLSLAQKLMKKAADMGLAEAHYDYGLMLTQGAASAPDPVEGTRQISIAARLGNIDAQVEFATLLYLGRGIPEDRNRAMFWYRKAALAGNAVAQNRLAKLLAAGEGVDLDLQTAAMWRSLARRQGLNDTQLDDLLVSISPEDLQKAELRARFWPGEPSDELLTRIIEEKNSGQLTSLDPLPTQMTNAAAIQTTSPASRVR